MLLLYTNIQNVQNDIKATFKVSRISLSKKAMVYLKKNGSPIKEIVQLTTCLYMYEKTNRIVVTCKTERHKILIYLSTIGTFDSSFKLLLKWL